MSNATLVRCDYCGAYLSRDRDGFFLDVANGDYTCPENPETFADPGGHVWRGIRAWEAGSL